MPGREIGFDPDLVKGVLGHAAGAVALDSGDVEVGQRHEVVGVRRPGRRSASLAAALSGDVNYHRCTELFTALHLNNETLLVPSLVVTEVCYLPDREAGPHVEAGFLASLADGTLTVVDLEPVDYTRPAELVVTYADLPLGAVDASVVAIADVSASRRSPPWTAVTSPSCGHVTEP